MLRQPRPRALLAALSASCLPLRAQQPVAPENLARAATASAAEDYGPGFVAAFANDGDPATRWSCIPGHNTGVWFQLDWPRPVTFRQVVLQQFDTFVLELDVQAWDAAQNGWRTLQHCGVKDRKLPRVVVVGVAAVTTDKLRIGNITNGPSFTEVEVYAEPVPPVTVLGADLIGNVLGEVCDAWGATPVVGAPVELSGVAAAGPWRASATSDAHGMFRVPMPIGLRGEVAVRTTVAGVGHATRWPAVGLQYGLTPGTATDSVGLDGEWKFQADPPDGFADTQFDDAGWTAITVPGHWSMQGFRAAAGGYRRRFDAATGGGRCLLRFDGVYSGARVWVNGALVAEHDGGAVPFEADITDVVLARDNVLAVLATEHTVASDRLDKMSAYADLALGGIFRSVRLLAVPALHLGAVALATSWEEAAGGATVRGTVSVLDASAVTMNAVELRVSLRAPGGGEVANALVPFVIAAWTRRDLPVSLPVPAANGWNAEQPFLYDLVLELRAGGRTQQVVSQRFGLRQTEVRGSELLVNGRPVKLRGTCHHDSEPLLGRAVTAALQRRDVELMREANLNAVRTSHYPPHEALLFAADELGLYVEDEASFCWTDATDDLRLLPRVVQLVAEMVARDRNHASVTFWSLCNESRVGAGLWRACEQLRRLDPSRPVAGSWARDGSLEFAVRHNPITLAGIDAVERDVKAPVLWDESWCIWQDIWGDAGELWRDPGLRDAYIVPLPAIYDRCRHSPVVQGTMIWAWSDDIFLLPGAGLEYGRGDTRQRFVHEQYALPGRGVVGDAQWGVVDGWRRKKPEFWHTQKLHSPIRLTQAQPGAALTRDRTVRFAVENQYDFLDLAQLKWTWTIDQDAGVLDVAVPPRGRGELAIDLAGRTGTLVLKAEDAAGRMVDCWTLVVPPLLADPPRDAGPRLPPIRVQTDSRLNGRTVTFTGQGFELAIGEELGDLRRATVAGKTVLRALPRLHVLPTGQPDSPLPVADTWQVIGFAVARPAAGDPGCTVTVSGRYEGFTGSYVLQIDERGGIRTTVSFVRTGADVLVREIGLAFAVPRAADLLLWERVGEHTFYPSDHIGRPRGRTRAVATHGAALPPDWPWSQDNSPLGCNDFRSSKRNLLHGWIGYPDGPGVCIASAPHVGAAAVTRELPALRATVAGDHIDVFLCDYQQGCNSREEWTANYGTGRLLKQGEQIVLSERIELCADEQGPR